VAGAATGAGVTAGAGGRGSAVWRREARIIGWLSLAMPAVTVALAALSALTLALGGDAWGEARRLLLAALETVLPLAAGVATAAAVAGDRAVELQLSLGTPYRRTVATRAALVAVASGLAGLTVTGLLALAGLLPLAATGAFVLLWAAPLLWFVAAGAGAGLLLGRAAGGTLLAAVWLAQQLAGDQLAARAWTRPLWLFATSHAGRLPGWGANRTALLVQAAVLAAVAWVLLRRNDRLLAGDER